MLSGILDILTIEERSPGSRLRVSLSAQPLFQLNVQLAGVKGCGAVVTVGSFAGLTYMETRTQMSDTEDGLCVYVVLYINIFLGRQVSLKRSCESLT